MTGLSRPTTKAGRVQRVVLDLLHEHSAEGALPTNGRFVFYELEQRGLATKPAHDDGRPNKRRSIGWPPGAQDETDALTRLREQALVPWSWIVDEGRQFAQWAHASSVADYVAARVEEARINPWGDRNPPVIICESRATAGVLEGVAAEYLCPIAGTGGQSAGFLRTQVAPALDSDDTVLYLGDLDRSGADIEANTRCVLEGRVGPLDYWTRLGMTQQQADERHIEPIWKIDGRDRRGHMAIEVESLGQAEVVALVRNALDELLLPELLEDVQERERVQQQQVAEVLRAAGWSA